MDRDLAIERVGGFKNETALGLLGFDDKNLNGRTLGPALLPCA